MRSTETTAVCVAIERHVRGQQLEHQVRAVLRIDEDHLARRGQRVFDEASGERRRKKQVVDLDGAAPSFTFLRANREQLLRAQVADDQLAGIVGQQNRVGDRVDDAVEQVPLPIDAGVGRDIAQAQGLKLLAENLGEPQDVVVDFGFVALEEEDAEGRQVRIGPQRHGMQGSVLKRGLGLARTTAKMRGPPAPRDRHERIAPIIDIENELARARAGQTEGGNTPQPAGVARCHREQRPPGHDVPS